MDWSSNVLSNSAQINDLLRQIRRVAVLGMRPERAAYKPAHYVPAALLAMGLEIIPVPVADRDVSSILGLPVYHSLAAIPGPIDLVDVFRRPDQLDAHVEDILAARPGAVWLQSGIRNNAVAERLARAGIQVVQSRCLMVDYQQFAAGRRAD